MGRLAFLAREGMLRLQKIMRLAFVTLLLLVSASMGVAQTSVPSLPNEPAEIFAAAAPLYDFLSSALKPWHMKVSYQLYDEKSKPKAQGIFEYWWASPDTYRSTWSRPGVEHTDWWVNGAHYRMASGDPIGYFERHLLSDIEPPVASIARQDQSKLRFEMVTKLPGLEKLACVGVISGPATQISDPRKLVSEAAPVYCFEKAHSLLIMHSQPGGNAVSYKSLLRMQGLILPKELTLSYWQRTALTATIDTIDGISGTAAELTPPSGLAPLKQPGRVAVSSGVATGMLVKEIRPSYPPADKAQRISGVVVLAAVIGTDGKVHDLEILRGPSESLSKAAMDAVSKWEYKPYLLNGVPVDVETIINVVYRLGG